MVISLVFAHLWGVLQLIVLASFARTVRARTVYAALAAGLYLCAPVTAALQVALTKIVASSMGMPVSEVMHIAGYTFDPFIEELAKVLPLSLLLMVPLFRRQWSFTDCVLIGAATGAGFGLAEDLYRFGGSADHAQSIAGGWTLVFSGNYLLVPGLGHIVASWLPHGVGGSQDAARLNEHLIWSAVAGLAVGLTALARTKAARLTALGLFVCMSLDHAARNMPDLGDSWLAHLSWPLLALARVRALMPLAALGAAWWLDQQRQGSRVAFGPLLGAEQSGTSRLRGTVEAAVSRLPWSLFAVDRFVRMRRAARTEHFAAQTAPLNEMLVNERDRVDRELANRRTLMPSVWPPGWTARALRAALRRPTVILWLVIMTPSVLYFVVGGWPQTAGLQAFMLRPLVAKVLFPISVLAQVWISWRTIAGLRARSRNLGGSIGDDAALVGLRAACGIGAVSLGVFSLLRMLGGLAPGASLLASLHAQSAADRLTPGAGSMLSDGAGALTPPPPTVELPAAQSGAPSGASSGSPGNAPSNSNGASPSPPAAPPVPSPAPAPAPAPDPVAAADQDLAAAQQRRLDAQRALESAEIKQATGAADDPAVMAAEERASAARDAANAADIKTADDFKDPWAEKSASQAAADEARAQSHAADAARDDAVNAAQPKLDADAQAAQAADQQANADVTAAEAKAAQARADADANAAAAQSAAEQNAAAQQKAADPKGFAADEAAKAAADAQKLADHAFLDTSDPTGQAYHAANEAAQQARQQADAARAAADASHPGPDRIVTPAPSAGGKPFKP